MQWITGLWSLRNFFTFFQQNLKCLIRAIFVTSNEITFWKPYINKWIIWCRLKDTLLHLNYFEFFFSEPAYFFISWMYMYNGNRYHLCVQFFDGQNFSHLQALLTAIRPRQSVQSSDHGLSFQTSLQGSSLWSMAFTHKFTKHYWPTRKNLISLSLWHSVTFIHFENFDAKVT